MVAGFFHDPWCGQFIFILNPPKKIIFIKFMMSFDLKKRFTDFEALNRGLALDCDLMTVADKARGVQVIRIAAKLDFLKLERKLCTW
jgi:hypothetical protein